MGARDAAQARWLGSRSEAAGEGTPMRIFSLFKRKPKPTEPIAPAEICPVPAKEELAKIPEGTIVYGHLVKVGTAMIDIKEIQFINFEPDDVSYGCEIEIRGQNRLWQLSIDTTKALLLYFEGRIGKAEDKRLMM